MQNGKRFLGRGLGQPNPRAHGISGQEHDFHALFCCQRTRLFPRGRPGGRANRNASDPDDSGDDGNSTQFASATGSAVSAAVSGADIRVILAVTDQPSFDLIAQPNITSVQQLRGKKIGTGGVGSLAEILARRILLAHNVRPEDVAILATGPSHMTYLSLKAKVIDAAPLQMPLTFTAQDEGFRKLASAADVYRSVQGG